MLMVILTMWAVIVSGAIGGILRGVLGISKDLVTKKELTINWAWFGVTVGIAAILGVITASFFASDLRVAILGGYSGSDFVEGLMKLKINELFGKKSGEKQAKTEESKYGSFGDLIKMGQENAKKSS